MPFKEEVASRGQIRKDNKMRGLEALKRLMSKYNEMCRDTGCNDDEYQNGNTTSERAVIEQELKALEIIKEKYVNPILIKDEERVVGYNERVAFFPTMKLTKDEFDLLKEVLG